MVSTAVNVNVNVLPVVLIIVDVGFTVLVPEPSAAKTLGATAKSKAAEKIANVIAPKIRGETLCFIAGKFYIS